VVIAVDGPSGVGKSTVSGRVAAALGFPHLDTGATYRAVGLVALSREASLTDEDSIVAALEQSSLDIESGTVMLDDVDVTETLRGDAVTRAASKVASLPDVRSRIVAWQRAWVERHGGDAVVEGRDIGTVVFPNAALKIYLTARPEVKAARRSGDTEAAGRSTAEIAEALAARDHADSTRKASPLRPADDAIIIDTSDLSVDEVVERVLSMAEAITG
jgi:cytidylate kinase